MKLPPLAVSAFVLTRDGHAVPINGLSPDGLKAGKNWAVVRPGYKLKSTTCLNAVVGALGFRGDFGDYKRTHFPKLVAKLQAEGLTRPTDLVKPKGAELAFGLLDRRALADRIFFDGPMPRRVFTGCGYDWTLLTRAIDQRIFREPWPDTHQPRNDAERAEYVADNLLAVNFNLSFISDHLLDLAGRHRFVAKTYFTADVPEAERRRSLQADERVNQAFRALVEGQPSGWQTIIPITDRLVMLKGADGAFDFLWANYRTEPPPQESSTQDEPSAIAAERRFEAWYYRQHDRWAERDEHKAELHHYANGGRAGLDYPGSTQLLRTYLTDVGAYQPPTPDAAVEVIPPGFTRVAPEDMSPLLVSELISVGEFRAFAGATGYLDRREGVDWRAGNAYDLDDSPVAATFRDVQAFMAWKERDLGLRLRLLTMPEQRAIRPAASEHYERLQQGQFPWERRTPRAGLAPAVRWTPELYLPDEHEPESKRLRRQYVPPSQWPPQARWTAPIPWAEHHGLRYVDAWDAYEWCGRGRVVGRYWTGQLGDDLTWGAYKGVKISFRLAVVTPEGGVQ